MSGDVEPEAPRPRPLSAGLWTLFSWLRREDHSTSSESLSSVGSDRTTASFAFLAPAHYRNPTAPLVLPPVGPPTDSYKKRVHERNLRRHHDRDLTLRRKYGLYIGEGDSYDAFSLPSARRIISDTTARNERERRATSECLHRRAAHVPGKRRAPQPPLSRASSAGPSATINRPNSRKRPAPQPPTNLSVQIQEYVTVPEQNNNSIIQMNTKPIRDKRLFPSNDITMGCKSEKYSKKDNKSKDNKCRSEKSFLKQIFENKKRSSAVETAPGKILPSISELDKQAIEIIETCKLKELEQNNNVTDGETRKTNHRLMSSGDTWYCTRCLKKYNASIITCLHCFPNDKNNELSKDKSNNEKASPNSSNIYTQTDNNSSNVASTSKIKGVNEKEKLKEMLKEMKDSLPKRAKHLNNDKGLDKDLKCNQRASALESPTLRIGSPIHDTVHIFKDSQSTALGKIRVNVGTENVVTAKDNGKDIKLRPTSTNVLVTQTIMSDSKPNVIYIDENNQKSKSEGVKPVNSSQINDAAQQNVSSKVVTDSGNKMKIQNKVNLSSNSSSKNENNLHTPLKISSLLNPVYIPKDEITNKQLPRNLFFSQMNSNESNVKNESRTTNVPSTSVSANALSQPVTCSKIVIPIETKHNLENKNNPLEKPEHLVKDETVKKSDLTQSDTKSSAILDKTPSTSLTTTFPTSSEFQSVYKPKERFSLEQHSRRRDLINQLEQSIAKGDERAAADAAVKLAQLRLSCSVLSFSSQIVGKASVPNSVLEKQITPTATNNINIKEEPPSQSSSKLCNATQSTDVLTKKQTKLNQDINTQPDNKGVQKKVISAAEKSQENAIASPKSSSCKATTSKQIGNENNMMSIEVLVEDKEATRGPIRLRIRRQAVMGELRRQAEISLGLPARLQRWIVGRTLCTDVNTPLVSLAGHDLTAPFYLCVVESETNNDSGTSIKTKEITDKLVEHPKTNKSGDVYSELVQLERHALVPNTEAFECAVCMEECATGAGVVLRECVHTFCKECLSDVVRHCEEPVVSCPAMGCRGILQEREIRSLVSHEEYERWLARGLAAAESGTRNAFHCRTRDCTGWAFCEPGVRRFPCPVCKCTNCVPCQAIHEGFTCEQHRAKIQKVTASGNAHQTDDSTRAFLDTLISKGEALACPECSAVITKKWGCDWVKCSACKTEICWVTRGRRWGPGGRGDTTGGCRCGVDGKRCHPSCGYCH